MTPGTHGSTYAANPLSCAVVACVMGEISQPDFLAHVNAMAGLMSAELTALKGRSNKIMRVAGKGLMQGLQVEPPVKDVLKALRKNGLMATQAGADIVRLTPPLIVTEQQIKDAVQIIEKTLKEDF